MSGGLGGGDGGGLLWIDTRSLNLKSTGLLCGYLIEGLLVMSTQGGSMRVSCVGAQVRVMSRLGYE